MATAELSLVHITTRSNRGRLTMLYFASFVALGLTTGALGPTLPALAKQTNSSLSAISYLFTLRSLGYVCGALRGGRLFDRYAGNTLVGIMLLTAILMVTLIPLTGTLGILLGLMFLLGVAEAILDVGGNTLLVRVHQEGVAPYMNAMHSFFGVGALLAPLIIAQVVKANYSSTQSYFVLSLLLLPIAAFSFALPSPAIGEGVQTFAETTNNHRWLLFSLAVFLFLYVGAEVGFGGWIFTYAVTTKLGTAAGAAYLTSLFWGSLTAGRALLIPLAAKAKPESILLASLIFALASLIAMSGAHSLVIVSVATAGLGFSVASIFPATMSFAGARMKMTGRVAGWFIVGSSMGATLIPLSIGQLITRVGPRTVLVVPALVLLVGTVLFGAVARFSRRSE